MTEHVMGERLDPTDEVESNENCHATVNNDNKEINGTLSIDISMDDVNIESEEKNEYNPNNEDTLKDIPVDKDNGLISSDHNNGPTGNVVLNKNVDISLRVQSFKDWGYNAFVRTKQKVKEKFIRTSRTVDLDLEDRIDIIRLQQIQYKMLLNNYNRMTEHLRQNILIHQCSARMFAELAQSDKLLADTFICQSKSESLAAGHFKDLIDKLVISTTTLETLVTKTFDDMMLGIQAFERARVEYDAFKTETVKLVSQIQQKSSSNSNDAIKLQEMQDKLEQKREKYESSKCSVIVKLDLLVDNKTRVIQREVLNLRHAWFTLHSSCLELYSGDKLGPVAAFPDRSETSSEPRA